MTGCDNCKYFVRYAGSRDRYGVPQEPDDFECKNVDNITEEDFETYFCSGQDWDEYEDGCSGFEQADWGEYED